MRLVNTEEEQLHCLLNNLFTWVCNLQRAFLSLPGFGNVDATGWIKLVLTPLNFLANVLQKSKANSVLCLLGCTNSHISGIRFDFLISKSECVHVCNYMNQSTELPVRIFNTPFAQQLEPSCTSGFRPSDNRRTVVANIGLSPFGCVRTECTLTKHWFPRFSYYGDSIAPHFWSAGLCPSSTNEPDWVRILLPLDCLMDSCSTYCVETLIKPRIRAIVDCRRQEEWPTGTSAYTWEVIQVCYPIHTNLIQPLLLVQTSWTHRAFIPASCFGVNPHTRKKIFTADPRITKINTAMLTYYRQAIGVAQRRTVPTIPRMKYSTYRTQFNFLKLGSVKSLLGME